MADRKQGCGKEKQQTAQQRGTLSWAW
jgi:hypothetical protein